MQIKSIASTGSRFVQIVQKKNPPNTADHRISILAAQLNPEKSVSTTAAPSRLPFSIVPVSSFGTSSDRPFKPFLELLIDTQKARFSQHPILTEWLSDINEAVPDEKKLRFMMPAMNEFAFGFQDFNKGALHYPNATTDFHRVINDHVEEDKTHAKLFLTEWKESNIDDLVDWGITGFIRAGMSRNDTKMKESVLELYRLVYDNPHPFARFAIMEAIESAGKEFFEITAPIAERLIDESRGKKKSLYFGPHHLALETGYLEVENVFELATDKLKQAASTLTETYGQDFNDPEFRKHIEGLVEKVGDIFINVFDQWYEDAAACVDNPDFYKYPIQKAETDTPYDSDLKAFVLVDVVGSAFLCRFFDFTSSEFSESQNKEISFYAKGISEMGDIMASDCEKIGVDSTNTRTSDVLNNKFFKHPFNENRENLILFFKKMIESKNAIKRVSILRNWIKKLKESNVKFEAVGKDKDTQLLGNPSYFNSLISKL